MSTLRQLQQYYQSFSGTDALVYLLMYDGSKPTLLGALSTLSYSSFRVKRPVNPLGQIVPASHTFGPRTVGGTMIFSVINSSFVQELRKNNPRLQKHGVMKADELPLFDLMIVYGNEYGASSTAYIYGVSIVDENQVISVEDLFAENSYSFIAKDYAPFAAAKQNNSSVTTEGLKPLTPEIDSKTNTNTSANKTEIHLNNVKVNFIYGDIINEDNRNFVPLRDIFDAIGYPTWWLNDTDGAVVKIGEYYLTIDPKTGRVDGSYVTFKLKKKPYILNPKPKLVSTATGMRAYIPIGPFFTDMGCPVTWDPKTKIVNVTMTTSTGINETDISITDLQQSLNRLGQKGSPVQTTGIMNPQTRNALKELCLAFGLDPQTCYSETNGLMIYNEDLKYILTRPNAMALKKPELKTATLKDAIPVYVSNSTSSRKITALPAKSQVTIIGKSNGWMQISLPKKGWVEARFFA